MAGIIKTYSDRERQMMYDTTYMWKIKRVKWWLLGDGGGGIGQMLFKDTNLQ